MGKPSKRKIELIAAQAGPKISDLFIISYVDSAGPYHQVTLTAIGLIDTDVITIEIQAADGTWEKASSVDGDVALSDTANSTLIVAPGVYRVNKGVTIGTVSVTLYA